MKGIKDNQQAAGHHLRRAWWKAQTWKSSNASLPRTSYSFVVDSFRREKLSSCFSITVWDKNCSKHQERCFILKKKKRIPWICLSRDGMREQLSTRSYQWILFRTNRESQANGWPRSGPSGRQPRVPATWSQQLHSERSSLSKSECYAPSVRCNYVSKTHMFCQPQKWHGCVTQLFRAACLQEVFFIAMYTASLCWLEPNLPIAPSMLSTSLKKK